VGKTLTILLNGKPVEVDPETTVGRLVDRAVPDRSRVAVECNREIVLRGDYDATAVEEGDRIEIVTLMGGG